MTTRPPHFFTTTPPPVPEPQNPPALQLVNETPLRRHCQAHAAALMYTYEALASASTELEKVSIPPSLTESCTGF